MQASSTVHTAKAGTRSLKATIPFEVCSYLELSDGDELLWDLLEVKGKKIMVVRKGK